MKYFGVAKVFSLSSKVSHLATGVGRQFPCMQRRYPAFKVTYAIRLTALHTVCIGRFT